VEDNEDFPERGIPSGSRHYRAFVGPLEKYDLVCAMQFNLLTFLGLREHHYLLDLGCGSLRGGKIFIPYLLPGRYYGIEPEQWLIEEGFKKELGEEIIHIKRPIFRNDNNFTLSIFNRKFDFILAHSIFSHASQQQIRRCLSEANKVMMPTSIFIATFIKGEKNYTGNKWVYPNCVTYKMEYMTSLIEDQGLICKPIDWPHPNQQTWIVIGYPENKKNIPDLNDIIKISRLENELKFYKERLSRIEEHPYVKLYLKIKSVIKRIKQ